MGRTNTNHRGHLLFSQILNIIKLQRNHTLRCIYFLSLAHPLGMTGRSGSAFALFHKGNRIAQHRHVISTCFSDTWSIINSSDRPIILFLFHFLIFTYKFWCYTILYHTRLWSVNTHLHQESRSNQDHAHDRPCVQAVDFNPGFFGSWIANIRQSPELQSAWPGSTWGRLRKWWRSR